MEAAREGRRVLGKVCREREEEERMGRGGEGVQTERQTDRQMEGKAAREFQRDETGNR